MPQLSEFSQEIHDRLALLENDEFEEIQFLDQLLDGIILQRRDKPFNAGQQRVFDTVIEAVYS